MIRAHLATFPPRRALAERVVERIAPQVDRLFVVLNGYDAVPETMAQHPNVTAHIPDRDVKDAGKFWFSPDASDLVFLIDDDIGYPEDYVARVVRLTRGFDLARNVFGYHGHVLSPQAASGAGRQWLNYFFHKGLGRVRGVSVIGTGTLFALGANVAPLSVMEAAAGFCDIRYNRWLHARGVLPWVLPRPAGYLTNDLPGHLWESSLFRTVNRAMDISHRHELASFAGRWPHAGVPFRRYAAGIRAKATAPSRPRPSAPGSDARTHDTSESD
jgi:hypothetical protein